MASKIECIKKACIITDEIFILILKNIKAMKTEKDIDNLIRKEARKRKLKIAFPPVVGSAKNAAEIHHKPNKSKLKKGFLVLDFGVKVGGCCSDMTRTIYLGKASKKENLHFGILFLQNNGRRKYCGLRHLQYFNGQYS